MLKNLTRLHTPELLHTSASMGHGDDLAIVDAHFPAVSMAQRLVRLDGVDAPVLSRKLFANVNSLFANESEIVILGRHVVCQRDTEKGHGHLAQVHSRAGPSAGGNGGSSWPATLVWTHSLPR